jgi:hypothetical protein
MAKNTQHTAKRDTTRHKYKKTSIGRSHNTKRRARKKYKGQG